MAPLGLHLDKTERTYNAELFTSLSMTTSIEVRTSHYQDVSRPQSPILPGVAAADTFADAGVGGLRSSNFNPVEK